MTTTNKGYTRKPPDDLVEKIGHGLTYISSRKGGFTLTYGITERGRCFRLSVAAPGVPLVTSPFKQTARAVKAFQLFQESGFSENLRTMFDWKDGYVTFSGEKRLKAERSKPRVAKTTKRSPVQSKRVASGHVQGGTGGKYPYMEEQLATDSHSAVYGRSAPEVVESAPSLGWWVIAPSVVASFVAKSTVSFILVCSVIALLYGIRNASAFSNRNAFSARDIQDPNRQNAVVVAFFNGILVAFVITIGIGGVVRWLL